MVVGGSFVGSSGSVSYVSTYSFDNSTWTDIGSTLPGPALALAVDNKNASSIFVGGYSTADSTPYLTQWDGTKWNTLANSSNLQIGSVIQQLTFVPMTSTHSASGPIESDRMLMISGDLVLSGQGNVTTALYDGSQFYPYLVGTTSTGTLGSASQLFWSTSSFSFNIASFLARGLVVLIAIAIATGLILLLILIFFLVAYLTRKKERKNNTENRGIFEKEGSDISSTHQNIFHNVQAALEQTLGARSSLGPSFGTGAAVAASAGGGTIHESGHSEYPVAAGAEASSEYSSSNESELDEGRETTMRYDFDGPDLQPGEMAMRAGQRLVILDDEQSHEWWYARDPASGREGVVPASYGECIGIYQQRTWLICFV